MDPTDLIQCITTSAELEAADIGSYDPGSDAAGNNLWSWLVAQGRTLGHVDGEGHCDARDHSDCACGSFQRLC